MTHSISRRDFFKTTAAVSAAVALGGHQGAQAFGPKPVLVKISGPGVPQDLSKGASVHQLPPSVGEEGRWLGSRKNAHREGVTFNVLPLRTESDRVDALDDESLRELQRLLRDLGHEKQMAAQQARLQPRRR